jgi:hypothetical protein
MPVPYTKRTIPELKTLLRERGYGGYSSLNKSQLIEMLRHQTPTGSKYEKSRVQKPAVVEKKRRSIGKKDCPAGSTRSPVTNRCRKDVIEKKRRSIGKKDCPAGSTRSPVTNRCRKDVIEKKRRSIGKKDYPVVSTRSQKTNRNRTDVVERQVVEKRVIKPYGSVGIPKAFADIAVDCSKKDSSKWVYDEERDYIARGVAGSAYYACLGKDDCKYVVKKQAMEPYEAILRRQTEYEEENSYKHEMEALIDLQGWKHAPKIYAAWTCGTDAYVVMERLNTCDVELMDNERFYKKMVVILEELKSRNWLHTDPHRGNIRCRDNGDIVLIDYGRARKFKNLDDTEFMDDHPWVKRGGRLPASEMYESQSALLRRAFSIR